MRRQLPALKASVFWAEFTLPELAGCSDQGKLTLRTARRDPLSLPPIAAVVVATRQPLQIRTKTRLFNKHNPGVIADFQRMLTFKQDDIQDIRLQITTPEIGATDANSGCYGDRHWLRI